MEKELFKMCLISLRKVILIILGLDNFHFIQWNCQMIRPKRIKLALRFPLQKKHPELQYQGQQLLFPGLKFYPQLQKNSNGISIYHMVALQVLQHRQVINSIILWNLAEFWNWHMVHTLFLSNNYFHRI